MAQKKTHEPLADLAESSLRAKRSCRVCSHPQREEIEEFLAEWNALSPALKRGLGLHRACIDHLPERVEDAPSRQTCVDHVRRCLGDASFYERG